MKERKKSSGGRTNLKEPLFLLSVLSVVSFDDMRRSTWIQLQGEYFDFHKCDIKNFGYLRRSWVQDNVNHLVDQ